MKKFIKEHYILVIIGFLVILFLVFIFIGFRKMYFTSNGDVYGNRLEGIEKVPIKDDVLDKAKKELLDSEKVENVTIRLQGKIVYFTIDYKEDVSIDQAKEIATKTLTEFTEEQKKFYDFSYLFRMKEEGNTEIIDIYDNVSDNRFNRYMFIFDKGEYDIRVIEECNVFVSYIYVYNVVDSKDKLLKLAYLFNLDNDLMVEYAKSFLPDKIIQILIKVIKKANK